MKKKILLSLMFGSAAFSATTDDNVNAFIDSTSGLRELMGRYVSGPTKISSHEALVYTMYTGNPFEDKDEIIARFNNSTVEEILDTLRNREIIENGEDIVNNTRDKEKLVRAAFNNVSNKRKYFIHLTQRFLSARTKFDLGEADLEDWYMLHDQGLLFKLLDNDDVCKNWHVYAHIPFIYYVIKSGNNSLLNKVIDKFKDDRDGLRDILTSCWWNLNSDGNAEIEYDIFNFLIMTESTEKLEMFNTIVRALDVDDVLRILYRKDKLGQKKIDSMEWYFNLNRKSFTEKTRERINELLRAMREYESNPEQYLAKLNNQN